MDTPAASESCLLALEFPAILDLLTRQTRTPYGSERARHLRPVPRIEVARALQAMTSEMVAQRRAHGSVPLVASVDVRPLLNRLEVTGAILSGLEMQALLEQMRVGQEVRILLAQSGTSGLRSVAREFPELGNLVRYLSGKFSPTGELEDECSPELLRIRRRIAAQTERLESALREIASRPEVARILQDTFVALRNNRHVLPVRIDAQGGIEGIVHALSSSGATVYVEPLSTVSLNNELVRLREEEEVETRRILLDCSDLLRSRLADLWLLIRSIGEVDLLSAEAALAEEMRAREPELTDGFEAGEGSHLLLRGARHPLLEEGLRDTGRRIVPLDLALEIPQRVIVLSGPNTGGKTVALKTVGLLTLMAQSGLHLPADEARLPVFRKILIDIGDHQSILESLSTFSARLANISSMARDLQVPALVLLDEVGTGTDPEEGASLGAAIIEYFRERRALVLATTHSQSIKGYAAAAEGAVNFSMDFDECSLQPLYRVRAGVPGRSGGIDIAERLGLPDEIIRRARQFLPRQRELLDGYLRSVQSLSENLERKTHEVEEFLRESRWTEREREAATRRLALERENRFAEELEAIAARLEERWNTYLDQVSRREDQRRLRREFENRRAELLSEARSTIPDDLLPLRPDTPGKAPPSLRPGDRVRIPALRVEAVVERTEGDRVVLVSGAKRLTLPLAELEVAASPAGAERNLPTGVSLTRSREEPLQPEINLIGKRTEEALETLDKYLDDAYLAAARDVRVIHGVGTGKLRSAIHRFLEGHPHVEGFSEAGEREGGRGATKVRIRH